MTINVIPSTSRDVTHPSSSAIARWGGQNWIVPANVDLVASDQGLSGAPLNAAAISTSGLDVSIDTFEAFIGGAWIGSDDNTASEHTHTLAGSSTTTELYLGKDSSNTDTFTFGPSGDFASADPKMPIVRVHDDGTSVTDTHDRRSVGHFDNPGTLLAAEFDDRSGTTLSLDTGTLAESYPVYEIYIQRTPHVSDTEGYLHMRLNGSSASIYHMEVYTTDEAFALVDDQTEFQRLAGTKTSGTASYGGMCYQVLRLVNPPQIVTNGTRWPMLNTKHRGVGKNVEWLLSGSFESSGSVDRINILPGTTSASTGVIEIYGLGMGYGE